MKHRRITDRFRDFLLVLVKASPHRACLSLVTGTIKHRRRLRALSLSLLMIATLLVSSFSALIPQQTARAAGSMADSLSLPDQVTSFMYYRTLGSCVTYSGSNLRDGVAFANGDWINQADAKSGAWFADAGLFQGGISTPGAYLKGIDGITLNNNLVDCSKLVSGALKLWGSWAPDQALCAMGFRRVDDGEFKAGRCTDAQGGTDQFMRDNVAKYAAAVKSRVYGGKEPSLSSEAKYLLYLKTFQSVCAPTATISTSASKGTTTRDYSVRQPSRVGTGATATVPITTTYYVSHDNMQQSDAVSISPGTNLDTIPTSPPEFTTCGDLVKAINGDSGKNNGLADAYQAYLIKDKGVKDTSNPGQSCNVPGATVDSNGQPCPAGTDATSCNIPQLGWILCPVLTTAGSLADSAYGFLADGFLKTDPSLVNTDPKATNPDGSLIGTGTYTAWGIMRNFANVAFVIVFLIVIFSQLTSVGLANYSLKKMLPKLVIAAILVNLSFFICQVAVDLSNIIGYSLKDVFAGITTQVTSAAPAVPSGTQDGGNVFGGLATLALTGALVWVNIGAFFVMVAGALVALLMIFVILIARKALIVLLIVIAPLAFVAYLLPNTEGWFKKWQQWLIGILMLFPIIGVVYGGSLLASAVLMQVAGTDVVMRIAAAAVGVIPLFVVPFILKSSLNAIGGIGGKINAFGAKAQSTARGGTQKAFGNSRLGQFRNYRQGLHDRRRAQIQGGTFRGNNANPLNWGRNLAAVANRGVNRASGNFGSGLSASGAALTSEEIEREVKNGTALMEQQRLTSGELMELAQGREVRRDGRVVMRQPNEAGRQAAVREKMRTGTTGEVEQLLVGSADATARIRQEMARGIHANGHNVKADYLGGDFADRVIRGEIGSNADLDDAAARRLNGGRLSAETMVGQDADALERIARVSGEASAGTRTDIGATQLSDLRGQATEAQSNDLLRGKITGQKAGPIDTISRL